MVISPARAKKFLQNHGAVGFTKSSSANALVHLDDDEAKERVYLKGEGDVERASNSGGSPAFGIYEFFLLLLTQCGYLPVAASLLSTTFFEPSKDFCSILRQQLQHDNTTHYDDPTVLRGLVSRHGEFYSLLFDWDRRICVEKSSLNVLLTTSVMLGGIAGSFVAGYLADRYGRRPVVIGTLLLLAVAQLILLAIGGDFVRLSAAVFFLKGCACGGYMVTNIVFILEAIRSERTRLLVASLNGWPMGMIFTGFIGWMCGNWRNYCWTVATTSICLAALLYSRSFESVGWLDNRNKVDKAERVRHKIVRRNERFLRITPLRGDKNHKNGLKFMEKPEEEKSPISVEFYRNDGDLVNDTDDKRPIMDKDNQEENANFDENPPSKIAILLEDEEQNAGTSPNDAEKPQNTQNEELKSEKRANLDESATETDENIQNKSRAPLERQSTTMSGALKAKTQTYVDLFKRPSIRRPLCALLFSFMTSSVVSFGFYFTADVMSGSRYLNLALMGVLKFSLGLLPFALSYLVSKKRIILGSVGFGCLACWTLAVICSWMGALESVVSTALGLAITASIDPTWKISHLYSVELFPVDVRNMARGLCNVTARLGSMAGPLIILFRTWNPLIPYWFFAVLLTAQLFVLAAYMPTHNSDDLAQEVPPSVRNDRVK